MFDHRGDTIQWWAIFFFVVCTLLCLVVGTLLIINNFSILSPAGIILIFTCTILVFAFFSLLSLLLYAVGQIIRNSQTENDTQK